MSTEVEIIKSITKKMKKEGTYSKSYSYAIETLARTIFDYEKAQQLFESSGGQIVVKYTNKNGSTNLVKNPIYQAMEKARADIIVYSRELGLTPSSKGKDFKTPEKNPVLDFIQKKV